jgi:Uma2 family endonuclease
MTAKPPHVIAVDATREAVAAVLPPGWWLRDEKPVRIPEFDEPEPDISVVRGSRQDYRTRHSGPGEIEFLVEVADTSLSWDRGPKLLAFARAGVPTYWILNLIDRQLEVYTSPDSAGYKSRAILGPSDTAPIMIAGVEAGSISVGDILT